MRTVFADTSFYIALLNRRDEHHKHAYQFAAEHSESKSVMSRFLARFLARLCLNSRMPCSVSTAR